MAREKVVDVQPLLDGPVFEPLKDPKYFAQGVLDPICGTVLWPNGADFAPEAFHELAPHEEARGHLTGGCSCRGHARLVRRRGIARR